MQQNQEGSKAAEEQKKQQYQQYVKEVTPMRNIWWQMCKAFVVGGLICVLGQMILNVAAGQFGLDDETAAAWCSIILVFLSALFTGLNLYQKLGAFAGAGALVPITGFANSVCAPAIEFQKEGQVFGIGVKIFTIAGPVILYGIFTSWCLGFFYWLGIIFRMV